MAPVTIALGPGFCAGEDVDAVIETMRGHDLGRLIISGSAAANTGIPGEIGGKSGQRVIHAPVSGTVIHKKKIGDIVKIGEVLFSVGAEEIRAPFTGLLRGLIREGLAIPKGMKAADIDPRIDVDWRTISDKARCLGGSALEAYFNLLDKKSL
jgi:xanthine dehydrogenase accessory factor